jgi:hypothetical protein
MTDNNANEKPVQGTQQSGKKDKTREFDDPPQMFDSTFKYLLHSASHPALVRFITTI